MVIGVVAIPTIAEANSLSRRYMPQTAKEADGSRKPITALRNCQPDTIAMRK